MAFFATASGLTMDKVRSTAMQNLRLEFWKRHTNLDIQAGLLEPRVDLSDGVFRYGIRFDDGQGSLYSHAKSPVGILEATHETRLRFYFIRLLPECRASGRCLVWWVVYHHRKTGPGKNRFIMSAFCKSSIRLLQA